MSLNEILVWLEEREFATAIREVGNWFPWLESFHVLFVSVVVGTIVFVDLRLLGWTTSKRGIRQLSHELLPYTWAAFLGAAVTGATLFVSKAVTYAYLWPFQVKAVLLLLAGLNVLYFHFVTWNSMGTWDKARIPPRNVRISGALSLTLWALVIVCGRWTGFTAEL